MREIKKFARTEDKLIWFHAASLGEFEQGRPLMEAIKEREPDTKIILTFFSPSGFEIRKNYSGADYIFYLPGDSRKNAKIFLNNINPDIAIFVKYELWYNYLKELDNMEINTYLISAVFNTKQVFFRSWGGLHRNMLKLFTTIFVQDEESVSLLNSIGVENSKKTGDTRFDRVKQIADKEKSLEKIEKFANERSIIVCGSTWPKDEDILINYINNNSYDYKWIIAPHEVNEAHIKNITNSCTKSIARYSDSDADLESSEVLIIDCIGILSAIYRYGKIAYIGGAFTKGLHNTIEAAVYGIPVIFGPKYDKFIEAVELIEVGGAFSIENEEDFREIIDDLSETEERADECGIKAISYVNTHLGATNLIINYINQEDEEED